LRFTRIRGLGCATRRGFAFVVFRTGGFNSAFGFAFTLTVATVLAGVAVTVGVIAGAAATGGVTAAGGVMAQLSFPGMPSLPAAPPLAHGWPPPPGGDGDAGGGEVAVPQLSDCVLEAEPPPSALHDVEALTVAFPVRVSATSNVLPGPVIVNVPDAIVLPLAVTA
jgi:hypothetical protein